MHIHIRKILKRSKKTYTRYNRENAQMRQIIWNLSGSSKSNSVSLAGKCLLNTGNPSTLHTRSIYKYFMHTYEMKLHNCIHIHKWIVIYMHSLFSLSNEFTTTISSTRLCHNLTCHCPTILLTSCHYGDVIMGAIASQITSLTIVYTIVYSDADQIKHQSSAPLAFVWEIHRGPVNSPHKWPVTRKLFPFDDVIMHCIFNLCYCEWRGPISSGNNKLR